MGNVSQSASSEPTSFPDAADIVENIHNGTIAVHSDRAAVTKKQIQIQINTIRRNAVNQGTLAQGSAWSSQCQTALMSWLQTKKDGRARSASTSQGSVPMLALPAPVHQDMCIKTLKKKTIVSGMKMNFSSRNLPN